MQKTTTNGRMALSYSSQDLLKKTLNKSCSTHLNVAKFWGTNDLFGAGILSFLCFFIVFITIAIWPIGPNLPGKKNYLGPSRQQKNKKNVTGSVQTQVLNRQNIIQTNLWIRGCFRSHLNRVIKLVVKYFWIISSQEKVKIMGKKSSRPGTTELKSGWGERKESSFFSLVREPESTTEFRLWQPAQGCPINSTFQGTKSLPEDKWLA